MALAVAAFAVPGTTPASLAETPDPSDPCTITGTPGPDVLVGTPGDDVICGGGGNDDLSGLGGDDLIRGGNGDDTVNGNEGHDYLNGGAGEDGVYGGAGDDHLNGSAGDDTVTGDAGNDDVRGGDGIDSLSGGDNDDILRSRDGGTVDSVLCGAGVDDEGYADLADTIDADCEFRKFLDLTPPTAVDDAATVTEDDPATIIRVRINDTDPDAGTKQIDSVTQPANGTVVIGAGKATLTYQPSQNYCNAPPGTTTDNFTYTLTPGGSTATVRVTVNCADDAPVAVDDTKTVLEDDAATTIDVLANDTDVDAGPKKVVDPVVSQPANGVVAVTNGGADLTYKPNANFCNNPPPGSTDNFSYALDPGGDTADVKVTVSCVNDGPVADDESFTATAAAVGNTVLVVNDPTDGAPAESGPHKVVSGDILDGDLDIDGGPLAVTAATVTSVDGGTAVIQADGDFVFTPAAGTSCTDHSDSFDYTVNDGNGGTDTGTVTIETTGCVWYVNNSAAPNGGGTSNAAFDTLAEAEASSAANDTIYVYDGNNTTTGYATGITLKAGQRLLGELADLAIGGNQLATGTAGKRPTLTASGVDVVTLGAGNTVRGVEIDPAGAGGIFGSAGDINGTITDVRIVDSGAGGTQPGLELDGTTGGTYNVSDLTVSTVNATGIRLNNAGTVAFADTGTISVTTNGARAVELISSSLGASVFDSVTVSNSSSGGVAAITTTGSLTFHNLDLTTTSGTVPAFTMLNAAGVTVPAAGTATISATGGPAVDVANAAGAVLSFDSVSSTSSASDGVNLDSLLAGTFSAPAGTISGASGIAFDLNGGSGDVSYGGSITNGAGATAEVTSRGGGTVTFSGAISDNNDAGGGISLANNTSGTTVFSASTVLDTQALNAVSMTTSDGHTLGFSGGLTLTTTSGRGFNADTSGTVAVTGATNTITSTGGGRALSVVNTDIGAADLTFRSISATGGGSNGIVLDATGSAGNLVVTGNGGTCTIADTTGCSGGTISGFVGSDDSGQVPAGTGIVLRNTTAPSFTRIRINGGAGGENYGIRGVGVTGFTLVDSVLDGSIGTSALTAHKDGAIRFGDDQTQTTGVTGTLTMTNVALSGGYYTNLMVDNYSGVLNATLDNVDSLALDDTGGDDAVQFEGIINAGMNVTYQNSSITDASGDLLQYIGDGSGGGDLNLLNNTFTNNEPSIVTGGGGIALVAGARGPATMDVLNNTMRDSKTNALTIIKSRDPFIAGTNNLVANISNNTIGVAATANSGSVEGDGMEISTWGDGNATYNVTNNAIRQYNSSGIQFIAGGGVVETGQLNLNVSGNTVANPGTTGTITLLQGIRVDSGVTDGDSFATCVDFGPNSITGSSDAANKDFRLFAFESGIRQPGYAGGATDEVAFANYAATLIGGGAQGTAFDNPPHTFSGTGTTCP